MRILHIITSLHTGGAELMLKRLIESFQNDDNYQHYVISLTTIGSVGKELQKLGVDVYAFELNYSLNLPLQLIRLIKKISSC